MGNGRINKTLYDRYSSQLIGLEEVVLEDKVIYCEASDIKNGVVTSDYAYVFSKDATSNSHEWVYMGRVQENSLFNMGTIIYANGDLYVGQLLGSQKHGVGKLTIANVGEYQGAWQNDKKHGAGTYAIAGVGVYEGTWEDDKKHGFGTYTWSTGDKYVGDWRYDKKHGVGTYTTSGLSVYEGTWEDDKKHGFGIYTSDSDGSKLEGVFKNDVSVGYFVVTDADESRTLRFYSWDGKDVTTYPTLVIDKNDVAKMRRKNVIGFDCLRDFHLNDAQAIVDKVAEASAVEFILGFCNEAMGLGQEQLAKKSHKDRKPSSSVNALSSNGDLLAETTPLLQMDGG